MSGQVFSGLLLDLMFGPYIGMYAFGYLLCGYLLSIGNRILQGYYISCINDRCGRFCLRMLYAARLYDPRQIECAVLSERIIFLEAVYTVIIAIFLYQNHINYY